MGCIRPWGFEHDTSCIDVAGLPLLKLQIGRRALITALLRAADKGRAVLVRSLCPCRSSRPTVLRHQVTQGLSQSYRLRGQHRRHLEPAHQTVPHRDENESGPRLR